MSDFEETTKTQNNAVTQTRKNAVMQERNNAEAQKRDGVETPRSNDADIKQQRDNATHVADNAVTQKRKKIVPRTNGCTYYIEDSHQNAIRMIKAFNDVDKQDVVRTALDLFLKEYMKADGFGLTEEGLKEIEKYIWEG